MWPTRPGELSGGAVHSRRRDAEAVKLDAEEDRDDFEGYLQSQTLFTDFLQGKIDELKALALQAGADEATVTDVCNRVYRRG